MIAYEVVPYQSPKPDERDPSCIECEFLAGSERTQKWLFASRRGYCDHPDRRGGPWNVLQAIDGHRTCKHFTRAAEERVALRRKALEYFDKRLKELTNGIGG